MSSFTKWNVYSVRSFKGFVMKSINRNIVFIWVCSFVLLLIIYMLVLAPQVKAKKTIKKELTEKKLLLDRAQKITQKETRLKLDKQIDDLHDKLRNYVVDFDDISDVTFDISRIANEKKVKSFNIKSVNRGGSVSKTGNKYVHVNNFDVSFTSGFVQFATLLNTLERNRPVIFVDKFRIIRSEENNFEHQVDMDLAVFVRKRKKG